MAKHPNYILNHFQGVFADDLSVAVSCTGTGETFMRAGVARRAAYMVYWYAGNDLEY